MDCTFIKNNLFALTEKQLPATELALAKEHIAGCAACSVYVTSFSSIMEVIEKDRKTEPNPFLATRIFQKMESQGAVANHNIFRYLSVNAGCYYQPAFLQIGGLLDLVQNYPRSKRALDQGGSIGLAYARVRGKTGRGN